MAFPVVKKLPVLLIGKISIKNRNIIADDALNNAIKSKPNPLYKKEYASRITTGNFDDDFEKIKKIGGEQQRPNSLEADLLK